MTKSIARSESFDLVNPFKGRALVRSANESSKKDEDNSESATAVEKPVYSSISVQYDYLNPSPTEKSEEKLAVATAPLLVLPNDDDDETKVKKNYIPKGNVLPRTPNQRGDVNTTVDRQEDADESSPFKKQTLKPSRVLQLPGPENRPCFQATKVSPSSNKKKPKAVKNADEKLKIAHDNLQQRIENAVHKVDTRFSKRRGKMVSKGIQVSLLEDAAAKKKLPQIEAAGKNRGGGAATSTASAKSQCQRDSDITVEEFVLEMVRSTN